jgi:predicted nucleotidyltransferase
MPRKASIFRLDPDAQSALAHLSRLLGRPMNKLVNEAVRDYLLKTSQKERELEHDLQVREAPTPSVNSRAEPQTTGAAREFVRRVSERYPVKAALLFGSRARGTHRTDSDVDVAVLLRGPRGKLMDTSLGMADIAFDVLLETNVYIEPLPIWQDEWEHPETHSNPRLIENIRREGLPL